MRICHVSPHLPPDQAANALLPAALGAWSRARGDDVTFVAHEPAQGGHANVALGQVEWIPRRARNAGIRGWLKLDAYAVVANVERALDRAASGADLLHLHSNGLIIEAAARSAKRRNIPYVLTLYGTEIWHYRKRRIDLFRRAYDGAAHVAFYSRHLMERAREIGLDRSDLSVIYPAVSDDFAPADKATRERWREEFGIREPHVILNVKRLHELAGQRYLIDAFAEIARERRDVRLVLCGTGPLRDALESQARSAGVGDRVTFAGLVSNDVIAKFCAVATVFALPSLLEALPTVAVEALASGTPVVSADHPGGVELNEIFGDDVVVVPKEDAPALAAALNDALEIPRRTRSNTAEFITQRFRPRAVMAAYEEVYTACRKSG